MTMSSPCGVCDWRPRCPPCEEYERGGRLTVLSCSSFRRLSSDADHASFYGSDPARAKALRLTGCQAVSQLP